MYVLVLVCIQKVLVLQSCGGHDNNDQQFFTQSFTDLKSMTGKLVNKSFKIVTPRF